jgi:TPR repeat protein
VAEDQRQAASWFLKSAEQGFAMAQLYLSVHYSQGRGIRKDEAEGYAWVSLAAEREETARSELREMDSKLSLEVRLKGRERARQLRNQIAIRNNGKTR